MVRYSLDPENPSKSCRSGGSNLRVHLKNKLPRPSRVCISEKPPSVRRMSLCRSRLHHFVPPMERWAGVPGGAGRGVSGLKRVLNFYCSCLKMRRVMLDWRVWMTFFAHWAHPGEQSPPETRWELTGLVVGLARACALPAALRRSFLRKSTLSLSQKTRLQGRKRSQKKLKKHNYAPGVNSARTKCK